MLRVDHTSNFLSSKCVPGIGFNFVLHYMYIYFFFDFHKSNNFVKHMSRMYVYTRELFLL